MDSRTWRGEQDLTSHLSDSFENGDFEMEAIVEEVYGDFTSRYPDVAVSINKVRFIFRCKNKTCKHVWAKEYRKVYRVMGYTEWSRATNRSYTVESVYSYQRVEAGRAIEISRDYGCPKCGRHGESNRVVGSYSDHKCDARCMGAKKGDCECSCGGKNHGINYLG